MTTILIHGLGQTVRSWENVIHYLDDKNIICIDLSILTKKPLTYVVLYEEVKRVCQTIDGKINIVGLSLGGVLALQYASEYPDTIASLVIINGQYKIPKFFMRVQNIVFRLLPNHLFAKLGITKQDFITVTKSMYHLDLTQQLHKITAPVLVANGQKDKINYKAANQLAKLLPHATLSIIENSGHEMNKDQPELLAQKINEFFNSLGLAIKSEISQNMP